MSGRGEPGFTYTASDYEEFECHSDVIQTRTMHVWHRRPSDALSGRKTQCMLQLLFYTLSSIMSFVQRRAMLKEQVSTLLYHSAR